MDHPNDIISTVKEYYDKKFAEHGPTPAGVDWNGHESQKIRFTELAKLIVGNNYFSLNDFGCGYGALLNHLSESKQNFNYTGFDISESMVQKAREINREKRNSSFTTNLSELNAADYTIASGIFNVKLSSDNAIWLNYMLSILDRLNEISIQGFSFNCLTTYSDKEFMKDHLYYADPLYFFDHCKRKYARNIALLHDYNLYEFTILVRKS